MDVAPVTETHHNRQASRFEIRDGESLIGRIEYLSSADGTQRVFFHTEVDDAYAGRGLAGRLAATAMDETLAEGLRIVPVCPFIAAYAKKHPEYAQHVDQPTPEHRAAVRARGASA